MTSNKDEKTELTDDEKLNLVALQGYAEMAAETLQELAMKFKRFQPTPKADK